MPTCLTFLEKVEPEANLSEHNRANAAPPLPLGTPHRRIDKYYREAVPLEKMECVCMGMSGRRCVCMGVSGHAWVCMCVHVSEGVGTGTRLYGREYISMHVKPRIVCLLIPSCIPPPTSASKLWACVGMRMHGHEWYRCECMRVSG